MIKRVNLVLDCYNADVKQRKVRHWFHERGIECSATENSLVFDVPEGWDEQKLEDLRVEFSKLVGEMDPRDIIMRHRR